MQEEDRMPGHWMLLQRNPAPCGNESFGLAMTNSLGYEFSLGW
jgi:hypothetical protein